MKIEPQAGFISFEGLEATKFWLRTFDLSDIVTEALDQFKNAPVEHNRISCPIIDEYKIDEGLSFAFIILCECDQIGLVGGVGRIFFYSLDQEEKVITARNEIADFVLEKFENKPTHYKIIKPGKEKDRLE